MSRSLRHPFKGSHHYLRAGRDRGPRRKKPRQPRMRQSRFSMEAMLDAPDTSSSRPGLRLRVAGLVVAALFALLGLRLWALTVLQAPAAAQAVSVNQIRTVPIDPTRGLILDRNGNPLVGNQVVEQITLSRAAALDHPQVIGHLAALIGQTTQQVQATIADPRYSPYRPVPVLTGGTSPAAQNQILSDILYISEHQVDFPGVSSVQTTERTYPQGELPGPAQGEYPASQTLGYVSTINAAELKADAAKGYQAGDAYGQSGLEYQYETQLRGTPGTQDLEVTPQGQVAGTVKTTPATAGDNVVTNLDTNLQQVADNALATQILNLRRTYDKQCNNNTGCYPAATGGAVIVMSPQTGAVYAMSSYPSYNLSEWVGGITTAQNAAVCSGLSNEPPSLNRAIEGQYIPGSTFKLNTATAALNAGLITPELLLPRQWDLQDPGLPVQQHHLHLPRQRRGSPGHLQLSHRPSPRRATSSSTTWATSSTPTAGQYGPHAHPGHRGPVQPGPADRHRPARRGPGPGGQPGRAGQAPRREPDGLPQHHLVHR